MQRRRDQRLKRSPEHSAVPARAVNRELHIQARAKTRRGRRRSRRRSRERPAIPKKHVPWTFTVERSSHDNQREKKDGVDGGHEIDETGDRLPSAVGRRDPERPSSAHNRKLSREVGAERTSAMARSGVTRALASTSGRVGDAQGTAGVSTQAARLPMVHSLRGRHTQEQA